MTMTVWLEWVRALVVIGWRRWRLEKAGWRGLWVWVMGGVKALVTGWRDARVSEDVEMARMDGCRVCPLFDGRLQTCGSMDDVVETRFGWEPVGCGCFMPVKVRFKASRCWLEERGAVRRWT